jgi:hypothetical protein
MGIIVLFFVVIVIVVDEDALLPEDFNFARYEVSHQNVNTQKRT